MKLLIKIIKNNIILSSIIFILILTYCLGLTINILIKPSIEWILVETGIFILFIMVFIVSIHEKNINIKFLSTTNIECITIVNMYGKKNVIRFKDIDYSTISNNKYNYFFPYHISIFINEDVHIVYLNDNEVLETKLLTKKLRIK